MKRFLTPEDLDSLPADTFDDFYGYESGTRDRFDMNEQLPDVIKPWIDTHDLVLVTYTGRVMVMEGSEP